MPIVGLTGGIGSGKSSVLPFFEQHGIHWVDMDIIARAVVEPGTRALTTITQHFQHEVPNILLASGELNRTALREYIFKHPAAKAWLEQLLHPLIRQRTYAQLQAQLQAHNQPYGLLVSPLLIEKQLPVDATIVVDIPVALQLSRASARDQTSAQQIEAIMQQQTSREERLKHADYIIDNSGDLKNTQQQITDIHQSLLQKFN